MVVVWAIEMGDSIDHQADLHARYGLRLLLDQRQAVGLPAERDPDLDLSAAEFSEVRRLFGPDATGLWTGHASISDLMDALITVQDDDFDRQQLSRLKLEIASTVAMGRSTGMAHWSYRQVVEQPNGTNALVINLGRGPEAISDALHLATSTFLIAADAIVGRYVPDLADTLRDAGGVVWRAWRDPAELARLRDEDPCPCDRPNTVWATCHKWTNDLGTATYTPFTDADLVRFAPHNPSTQQDAQKIDIPRLDTPDVPLGPHVVTFTFTLPFMLGLEDTDGHTLAIFDEWADPNDIAHHGKVPTVRIRLHNEDIGGRELWMGDPTAALQRFYGDRAAEAPDVIVPSIDKTYEQWISLETPGARLRSESKDDPAFAFHRCLSALNTFLAALDLAVSDLRISTISTHDVGPVVLRGAITKAREWVRVGDLVMHPEALPFPPQTVPFEAIKKQFDSATDDLRYGRPFTFANLWHSRSLRALRLRGDHADAVVSVQTAVESMVYELLRSLMVDEGITGAEITKQVGPERAFKPMLATDLPARLGGNWNLSGTGVVALYWSDLYLVRNRVVHGGDVPNLGEAERAQEAFLAFREFVSERLWRCWPRYPRTLLAKVGANGLERRGWMTGKVRTVCGQLTAEPLPFYWPRDVAGR
jgi:hypothetical protein